MSSSKDRPPRCPCPKTCTPIFNTMFGGEVEDLNDGNSGWCVGRMETPIKFVYNNVEHLNDLNDCFFSPLKGIIRSQVNLEDLDVMAHAINAVVLQTRPKKCDDCNEPFALYDSLWIKIKDNVRTAYCARCALRHGWYVWNAETKTYDWVREEP